MPKGALMLLALILAAGCIYNLSYLHATFEPIMLETLRISDLQFGDLRAMLGVVMMLCYFPGGWLADRFSTRNLITISLVSTGLSGIYMAALPNMENTYWPLFALHIFWGVSTTMTFWASLIKATHVWARDKQGMAFGILESGTGAVGLVCTMLAIALYDSMGQGAHGLTYAIMLQTSACLIAAVFTWLFIVDDDSIEHKTSNNLSEMLKVVRLPSVWLMSFIILCSYYSMWGTYNFAKYAVDAFEMEKVNAAYFSNVGSWTRCFVAFSAGFVADKLGVRRIVILSSIVGAAGFGVFTYGSVGKDLIYLLFINSVIISMGIYSLRGIYYALMKGSHIPVHLVGAAVGIISFIAYTPDFLAPLVKGHLLDYFQYEPLQAHRYYFLTCVLAGLAGAIATVILGKIQDEKRVSIGLIKPASVAALCLLLVAPISGYQKVEVINPKSSYPEGPLWDNGTLYYVESGSISRVMTWKDGANQVFWQSDGCGPASIVKRGADRFVVSCYKKNQLVIIDQQGKTQSIIDKDIANGGLLGPNDFVQDAKGGIYVTMSGVFDEKSSLEGKVYYLSTDDVLTQVAENLHYPNGLALTPDGKFLLVNEHLAKTVTRFEVLTDGGLGKRDVFVNLSQLIDEPGDSEAYTGPDGLKIDATGNVFICQFGAGRILVTDAAGKLTDVIKVPAKYVTNVNFAAGRRTLFVTAAADAWTEPYPGLVFKIRY